MLSRFSVKKPYTVLVSVVLVLVLGIVSFTGMITDLFPEIELPFIIVITTYPGADPEKVETTVTRPIEGAVGTTGGISSVTSTSMENVSMVMLEFAEGTNMDAAMIELSGNLDLVSGNFDDIISTPTLLRMSPDMLPIMQISVDRDDMDLLEISEFVNDDIIPRLERIEGVASVSATGLVNTQIDVQLDNASIMALNEKMLNSISDDLDEAGRELNNAKQEINSGIAELDSGETELTTQSEEVSGELSALSAQIDTAAAQLAANLAQETILTTNKMAFEAEKAAMEQMGTAYDAINLLLPTMQPFVEDFLLDYINDTIMPTPSPLFTDYTAAYTEYVQYQLANTNLNLPILPPPNFTLSMDALIALPEQTFNDVLNALVVALQDPSMAGVLPAGFDTSMITSLTQDNLRLMQDASQRLPQIEAELANINTQLFTIQAAKPQLEQALKDVQDAYAELESGKMAATTGFAAGQAGLESAKVQLEGAQTEIDSAIEDFEEQRQDALKQADISGIITPETIQGILMAQNFALPAGYIDEDGSQYLVKVGDEYESVEELENTLLFSFDDIEEIGDVYLKDVATVTTIQNSENGYAIVNGNDGIILSLQKQSIASTSQVSSMVNAEISEMETEIDGLHITNLMDQGDYIEIIISSVLNNLIYGGLLAIFVLILFLRDWRPTLIIAISIPFSLLCAITAMYFTNVTLNMISLSGLALGVGMLVDNSIVVIENIYRLRVQGVNPIRAAVQGAVQVSGAIFASTLTTVCVFLPIVFTQGMTRSLFEDMGLTIAYALLASLFVALTLVPTLGASLMKNSPQKTSKFLEAVTRNYTRSLKWTLRHKTIVLLFAGGLLALSIIFALNMGTAFIPSMQSTQMTASIAIPSGYDDEETRDLTRQIAKAVEDIQGVETVGASVGGGTTSMMMGGGSSDSISLNILLQEGTNATNAQINESIVEIGEEMSVEVSVQESTMDISALGGSGIEIVVFGQDLDDIQIAAQDMRELLAEIPGTEEISQFEGAENDETRLTVDKNKAMENGLTIAQVFSELSSALTPETQSTTLTLEGSSYPVMIIPTEESRITRDTLLDYTFTVQSPTGGEETQVRLGDIASVSYAPALTSISRDNGARVMSVTSSIAEGYNVGLVSREIEQQLQNYTPPAGIELKLAGENESINDAFSDMALMILLAVIFIYLIMVAQFQSLMSPFIVMFTILLAFTGGLLGLFITGQVLSVVSLIGFLVLAGIVVNNGIVFVDTINQMRISGVSRREAIVETGRLRLRPIVMTALTTVLAMITMALGIGEGAEMTQGLAIVTIGGLVYATILTLYVVPVLYDIMRKKEIKVVDDSIQSERDIIRDEFSKQVKTKEEI